MRESLVGVGLAATRTATMRFSSARCVQLLSDRLRGLWAVFTTKIPQWVMCRNAYPPAVCGCFDWCNRLNFASEDVGSQLVRFRTTCTSLLAFSCSHIRQCPSLENRLHPQCQHAALVVAQVATAKLVVDNPLDFVIRHCHLQRLRHAARPVAHEFQQAVVRPERHPSRSPAEPGHALAGWAQWCVRCRLGHGQHGGS